MILRKGNESKSKRKRKHDTEKDPEPEEDKYLAFKKKTSKDRVNKNKNEAGASTSSSSLDQEAKKKVTESQAAESYVNDSKSSSSLKDVRTSAVISVGPQVNKSAVKLNAALKGESTKVHTSVKSAPVPETEIKTLKTNSHDEEESTSCNVQIIEPCVEDVPETESHESDPGDQVAVQSSLETTSKESGSIDEDISPIIVEAHLKKSTSSYVPKALQDSTDSTKESGAVLLDEKGHRVDPSSIIPRSSRGTSTKRKEDNFRGTISRALQEFYDEMTLAFDSSLAEDDGPSNKNSKDTKALSMDESVKDCESLKDIINKNESAIHSQYSSNTDNVPQFFSLQNKTILVLQPKSQITFLGKLKVQLIYGAVELFGAQFEAVETSALFSVYSPRGYSSITIASSEMDDLYNKEILWDVLTSEGVDRSLETSLHNAIEDCEYGWAVLLLENLENTLTNFLNNHCSFKLFPRIENVKYPWHDPRRAECVLQAYFSTTNPNNDLSILPQWNSDISRQILNRWKSRRVSCTMVVGGRNVGKSTTAKYLINNFLRSTKRVVFLDLDPGQGEMTPPGCLSLNIIDTPLLGPNFTHLRAPFYQLCIEDVSVMNCITKYIESVTKLFNCLMIRKDLRECPIVINTMGFCRGVGLEICIYLIKLISPTDVVQIFSKKPKNNFDLTLVKKNVNSMVTPSVLSNCDLRIFDRRVDYDLHYARTDAEGKRQFETWNMEPRQQREIAVLSYLSQIIENAGDESFCSLTSKTINNIVPYEIPFSSVYISLMKSGVSPTHILAAMNGNIVTLCGVDLDDETSQAERESLKYPMVVIRPPLCTCYGFGIVRGVCMERRCIYINTPLSLEVLRHVNLLSGCSSVPLSLLKPGDSGVMPYKGDRGELPTSRETHRGYFRMDQSKKS
ncbi:hypothetical protein QAD02_009388 [Eretmocerus hayati]|uniref:Uncharacterized protein n=1 Tax=Eretmocerus hayati TaxID=131215 RepID=A0ACC2NDN0_9HYME|nr:hypothetical protein QAD02_009388 [Eretmocerus hayati]